MLARTCVEIVRMHAREFDLRVLPQRFGGEAIDVLDIGRGVGQRRLAVRAETKRGDEARHGGGDAGELLGELRLLVQLALRRASSPSRR